jgi:alpha-1,2-glucosyltransferase
MESPQLETGLTRAARYSVPFILLIFVFWRSKVNTTVPEPYLDEVFHVGQAQAYWTHNWTHWDPKITTPPGLYLWSYLLCAALLLLRGSPEEVGPGELRATNVAATAILLPWRLQTLLDLLRRERNTRPSGAWISHTVLNICLFPPLFFFSALYYTDILALLVVVEAYIWDIKRSSTGPARKSWSSALRGHASLRTAGFVMFGLAALSFRQTNVFWVSIFLGGLQVVRTLRENTAPCKSSDLAEIIKKSSSDQELYDPLVEDASFVGGLNVKCLV